MLLAFLAGAHQAENLVRVLSQRGPGLLPVDDVEIAFAHGGGLQGGEIRAGARLGIALTPPIGAVQNAGQPVVFLLFGAELVQHRAEHGDAERHDARGMRQRGFGLEDEALHHAPIGAAAVFRPVRGQPAAIIEDGVPFLHVRLGQVLTPAHLVRQPRRQLVLEKCAHFLAEGFVFFGKIEIH